MNKKELAALAEKYKPAPEGATLDSLKATIMEKEGIGAEDAMRVSELVLPVAAASPAPEKPATVNKTYNVYEVYNVKEKDGVIVSYEKAKEKPLNVVSISPDKAALHNTQMANTLRAYELAE